MEESLADVKLICKALIVGIVASLISILYRFTLGYAEKAAFSIYGFIKAYPYVIPLWFMILALIAFMVSRLIQREPYISGSGIPQTKAFFEDHLTSRPLPTIIYKFIGGTLCIVGGLSLGREGPSIQLGASVGDLFGKRFKSSQQEHKLLLTSGASAGLAAAFNAPLAGILFTLEELYTHFSPAILLAIMTASVISDLLSKLVFGLKPVFDFALTEALPLKYYGLLLLVGVMTGILGVFYNWLTLKSQALYQKLNTYPTLKIMIPFMLTECMGLLFPLVLCGGHAMFEELSLVHSIGFLFLMVLTKFLFSIACFGSGAPGGIFFPLLIIGGGWGAILGSFFIRYLGMPSDFFACFIIVGMVGYFTSIVRAPITGIILLAEMTGSFIYLLPLMVVTLVSYVTAQLLKSTPIYDSLLEGLLQRFQMPSAIISSTESNEAPVG